MRKFWESIYSPNYITGYNPFILKNMNKAIEHMVEAINNRKKIVIYGVPNVDGLCAISSLILVLKYLNADIEYIIHDEASSSGIISEDIKNNVSFLGGQLLITLGIDLSSERDQKGCQYRYKNLSISGLTFKLMQAIAIYYNIKSINKYLDLILIGEQWAEVPLKGENGVILKEGRKFLINTNNYGLRSIMNYYSIVEMDEECILKIIDVITPTINAVTMMDNARIIIELLTTTKKDRAEQITKYLNKSKMTI